LTFFWMVLELLNWLFLWWIYKKLIFLIWQRIASISFLYFWLNGATMTGLVLSLLAKIGLPPFITWVWSSCKNWKLNIWILFITFHKVLPFILLVNTNIKEIWILIWPLIGALIIFYTFSLKRLTFISSIRDGAWLIFSYFLSTVFFWLFMILYRLAWFYLRLNWKFNLNLILFLLLALPPSIFFFFKLLIWLRATLLRIIILTITRIIIFFIYWNYHSILAFLNSLFILKWFYWEWTFLIRVNHLFLIIVL